MLSLIVYSLTDGSIIKGISMRGTDAEIAWMLSQYSNAIQVSEIPADLSPTNYHVDLTSMLLTSGPPA